MLCTCGFILIVLVTKGENSAPTTDTVNAAIACGAALYALIKVASTGGPCFNPAIGVVLTVYQYLMYDIDEKDHLTQYAWVYTVGPAVGAIIAGIVQILHARTIKRIGETETAEVTILND